MSNQYYSVLTDLGQQLITEAQQAGEVVTITQMAFGDAGQQYFDIAQGRTFTQLVNQTAMLPLTRGPQADTYIGGGIDISSADYPEEWVYECGLFDDIGNLIIYCMYPPSEIPATTDTVQKILAIDIGVILSNTENITVYVDPILETLTKAVADTLYFKLSHNFSEFEDDAHGDVAKKEAREHLDVAPRSDLSLYYSSHHVSQTTYSEVFNRFGEVFGRGSYLFKLATYATIGQSGAWYTLWVDNEGVMGLTLLWESTGEVGNQPELFIQDNRLYVRTNHPDTLYYVMVAVEECEIDAAHRVFDFYKQLYSEANPPMTNVLRGSAERISGGEDMLAYFVDNPEAVYRVAGSESGYINEPPGWVYGPLHFQLHGKTDDGLHARYGVLTAQDAGAGVTWVNSLNNSAWLGWRKNYDNVNKPTPAEIEAYPMTGGTLNGGLRAASGDVSTAAGNIVSAYGVYESGGTARVYSPNNPPPGSAGDSYSDTMLGGEYYINSHKANPGSAMTGADIGSDGIDGLWGKPIQKCVNGGWYTVAG